MRMLAVTLTVVALIVPAYADDLKLKIVNLTNQTITRVNTYPVDEDGDPVEDNIGNTGGIEPGSKLSYPISLYDCGMVLVSVGFEGNDEEFQTQVDLCKEQVLVVKD